MAKDVKVSWAYSEIKSSNLTKLGDVDFYRSLPGMEEHLRTSDGRIPGGSPDSNQIILWGGTAVGIESYAKCLLTHDLDSEANDTVYLESQREESKSCSGPAFKRNVSVCQGELRRVSNGLATSPRCKMQSQLKSGRSSVYKLCKPLEWCRSVKRLMKRRRGKLQVMTENCRKISCYARQEFHLMTELSA